MAQARLTAGTASRLAADAVNVPHTRMGSRLTDMPGARQRSSVTTKFAEPTTVEMPRNISPSEYMSMLMPGIVLQLGVGHVGEPAAVRRLSERKADV